MKDKKTFSFFVIILNIIFTFIFYLILLYIPGSMSRVN
jgi:hypothetical protein